jgi:hypothetical protein
MIDLLREEHGRHLAIWMSRIATPVKRRRNLVAGSAAVQIFYHVAQFK